MTGRRSEEARDLVPLTVDHGSPTGRETDRAGLDHSGRTLLLGVLLVGLVVAGALTGIDARDPRREASFVPPAPVTGDEPAPEGWRRGAPGPLRHRDFAAQAWTGTELVVWGGDPDGDSGAAYDPASDRWRVLPDSPITASSATMSVWTGTEWVIANPDGPAAALEPGSGTWRTLTPVPRRYTSIVGQWTGREVVVLGIDVLEKASSTVGASSRHWAAALDPSRNQWRALPQPPLELGATAVWDGQQLIAWDQNLHTVALNPNAATGWTNLPDVPVTFADCSPQGARLGDIVFAEECGQGAIFRPSS